MHNLDYFSQEVFKETMTCKLCHKEVKIVNLKGICRACTENSPIKMHCREEDCRHEWTSPGLAAWCPVCGSVNITTDDKTTDSWIWQKEAERNGIRFVGIQPGGEFPDYPIFQDDRTGSFTLGKNETVEQAMKRKLQEFSKAVNQ